MAIMLREVLCGVWLIAVCAGTASAQSVEKKAFAGAASIKQRDCDRVQVTVGGKAVAEIKVGEAVILTKPAGDIGEKCSAYPGGGTSSNFGFPCSLAIVQFRPDAFAGKWVLETACYK